MWFVRGNPALGDDADAARAWLDALDDADTLTNQGVLLLRTSHPAGTSLPHVNTCRPPSG